MIGIGIGHIVLDQSQVVESGIRRAARSGKAHLELRLRGSLAVGHKVGRDGIFNVIEAIIGIAYRLRDTDVGNFLSIDGQRGHSALVGRGEAAHHSQSLVDALGIEQRELHIAARLRVAVALTVVGALGGVTAVVILMTCLALLFARSDEIDGTVLQGFVGSLGLGHIALGKHLGRLLIPVAHVTGMVNTVEGLQRERRPLIGVYALALGINRKLQLTQINRLDTAQHVGSVADKQGCREQVHLLAYRTGRMVHATLATIFVLQCLGG